MRQIISLLCMLFINYSFAQNVGIGENLPAARLDIKPASGSNSPLRIRTSTDENIFQIQPATFNHSAYFGGVTPGAYGSLNVSNRFISGFGNPQLRLTAFTANGTGSQSNLQFFNENEIEYGHTLSSYTGSAAASHYFRLSYRTPSTNNPLMAFDGNEKMGIGVVPAEAKVTIGYNSTIPSATLNLLETQDDFARLSFSNSSVTNFWTIAARNSPTLANRAMNFYNSVAGDVMSISGNGNVGINETSPAYRLTVDGNVNTSSLAGTGTRTVKADANGTLTMAPTTSYHSISFYAFVKAQPASASVLAMTQGLDVGASLSAGTTDGLAANIVLPHGSTLVNMRVIYRDNSAQNLDVVFGYTTQTTIGSFFTGTFTTSGASLSTQTGTLALGHVIDNSSRLYFVRVAPDTGDTWDGSNLYIKGIVFEVTQ